MTPGPAPARLDAVLVGGGHAHVQVLRSFGMNPEPGLRLTLIAKELEAPYSGMLPGFIAGHYTHDECHIDLVRLARFAGARLIHGVVTGIDRAAKRIAIEGRPPLAYDLASIDVGITPDTGGIEGAAEHALAVKPISALTPKWRALEAAARDANGPRRFVAIGGGAAGFELVHALRHRFRDLAGTSHFTLVAGDTFLKSVNSIARNQARRSLASTRIDLVEADPAVRISKTAVTLKSGKVLPADAVLVSTAAKAAPWFKDSGLPTDDEGFIAIESTLQLLDDDNVFAAGDCATVLEHPRDKSGVFAVRQGPPLTENLRLRARGLPAKPFKPQTQYLLLLTTGEKHAIAARGPLAIGGKWVWRWKDRIDREFVERFNQVPFMSDDEHEMRCGGCAAKVGPVTLSRALRRLDPAHEPEDAAIVRNGRNVRMETTDFFRAFWPEPHVFGEIAANHAMNDIHAMGGKPTHAQAIAVVPQAHPRLMEEDLFQLMSGARAAFAAAGVTLIGGHSSEGGELSAGFAISGRGDAKSIRRKSGVRPGDLFILTKPLGTGLVFAAEMRGLASAGAVIDALAGMRASNAEAARILVEHGVSAMTDVTGFGLAGHLLEMLEASGVAARIGIAALPAYRDVWALARSGVASSLLPENLALEDRVTFEAGEDRGALALLFDPQTAGGLLAAIDRKAAKACLKALRAAAAPHAALIGEASRYRSGACRLLVVDDTKATPPGPRESSGRPPSRS
jgi:selenide,water dikinase